MLDCRDRGALLIDAPDDSYVFCQRTFRDWYGSQIPQASNHQA
jgi:hypothetical protein